MRLLACVNSQTLRDCFKRYWATRSPTIHPSDVDLWVLETAVTDVVLLDDDDGEAKPPQTRPWVHVEALTRQLRWHSPHSAALMVWFAHGTDDGWCVFFPFPAAFPSASDRLVGGVHSPDWTDAIARHW